MIANNYDSFVALWRQLRQTQETFRTDNRRFCVRRILQHWHNMGVLTSDDKQLDLDELIWEVCFRSELQGYDGLPPPETHPRPHREMLLALAQVVLGLSIRKIDIRALDSAYSEAFPASTPLNVCKRQRPTTTIELCSGSP